MQKLNFADALDQILREDKRYHVDAYLFVKEALDYTVKSMNKPVEGPEKHVTGTELLDGVRAYALREFGPLTLRVLHTWGIAGTEDFGEIVFNLVNKNVLGKSSNDSKSDFANGYDFYEAFAVPFLPTAAVSAYRARSRGPHNKSAKTPMGNT